MTAHPDHSEFLARKRQGRMDYVDSLPVELRELTHEYGLSLVQAFIQCGVSKPKRIRHLIETTLNELSPTRGTASNQGPRQWTSAP